MRERSRTSAISFDLAPCLNNNSLALPTHHHARASNALAMIVPISFALVRASTTERQVRCFHRTCVTIHNLVSSAASIGVNSPSATAVAIAAAALTLSATVSMRGMSNETGRSFEPAISAQCRVAARWCRHLSQAQSPCASKVCLTVHQSLGSDQLHGCAPPGPAIGIAALSWFESH